MGTASISRVLRDLQTYLPAIRRAKFNGYNFLTRRFGLHVEPEFKLLARMGRVGLAIDIGGNWGQSIHALTRYAHPDRIISFEPNPALTANLLQIASAGGVEIETVGLGAQAGRFDLYVPRYRAYVYDGLASLDEESAADWLNAERVWRFDPKRLKVDRYPVEVRTLDSFGLSPDVVKIDVQGLETDVVRGGAETFARSKPVAIVETVDDELVTLFADCGMRPYSLSADGRLVADAIGSINTLFLSPERLRQLGG